MYIGTIILSTSYTTQRNVIWNNIAQMIDSLSMRKVRIHRCILYSQPEENGIKEMELSNEMGIHDGFTTLVALSL